MRFLGVQRFIPPKKKLTGVKMGAPVKDPEWKRSIQLQVWAQSVKWRFIADEESSRF